MRWQGRRESDNVEDRRSDSSGPSGGLGGGGFQVPRGKGGIALLVVVLVAGYYGVDLTPLLTGGENAPTAQQSQPLSPKDNEMAKFTSVVLASTEDTWAEIFKKEGGQYKEPKLVLYRGATRTACGTGQSVMGPFYCPTDKTVYIDLSFYQDMETRLKAGGDFAQAYVVAHEIGHHVQNLMGISAKVRELQQRTRNEAEVNRLSVKQELQADCFAGIWGNGMKNQQVLDLGDMEEALNAAQAIGDDRLQKQGNGRVIPDSFTHGTSEQRYTWFKRGFDSGDFKQCNTFDTDKL
ncbi:KPN_02809 family neutral zinc metallopeptidase [Budvicia diplopodorum]|uniref:KPN_02809 family neutral zinc metallopeptidase n=1 Tax=Budvicia diplopodorum TaxID=1119056 RepID=UPI00135C1D82|nr:neutral zinc metallopeptidase [Budvicia diplopodorum]